MLQNNVRGSRAGLTLMELVVVLVILVALAGIVLPLLPNLLTKTHDATTTTNIAEVNKAIPSYAALNLKYPDQFDSLMDTTGAIYSKAIFNPSNPNSSLSWAAATSAGNSSKTAFFSSTLIGSEATSLTTGGIANLWNLNASPNSATFDAYTNATLAPVAASLPVLIADDNYVYQKLNMTQKTDSNGTLARYLVLALGAKCTLVGATSFGIYEAPLAFGEHAFEQPNNSYARMLCVFRIYQDGSRAEYLGSAHPDATGLGTADMHFQEFYTNN